MEKKITYSANVRAIVGALRDGGDMTLAQLRDYTGLDLKPAHITDAKKKGLIEDNGIIVVEYEGSREVSTYNFVTADVLSNEEGKAFNYTEGETKILGIAAGIDSPFTLAELAAAMGVEKLSSGSINGLVRKGNFSKGEPREIPCMNKSKVKLYHFVADVPADAE